ncbi:MAG: class IV adenylate cyclase [Methanomicrobiaceae archaeon]|nr:class IV adenylate cyclase [Methanomicrobiaceae archaeon]
MLEVEAKIKIDSIDQIKKILVSKNAEFLGISTQKDTYYNAPHRDFAKTDEALRIRDNGTKYELTYKGPKIKGTGAKAREEYNVFFDSTENLESILLKLGFKKSSMVYKKREEYLFQDTTIALDNVKDLGEFIEIEVLTEDKKSALLTIESVKQEIGITGENIPESYLEMILENKESQ